MFEERYKKTGVKPGPLLTRPKLKREDTAYLDAYYSLSAARSSGFAGAEPIPLSEILAYVNLMGIASPRERTKYARLIQLLDHTYLEYARAKAEENKNKKG